MTSYTTWLQKNQNVFTAAINLDYVMINILGIDVSIMTDVMSAVKTTAKSQHPSRRPVLADGSCVKLSGP